MKRAAIGFALLCAAVLWTVGFGQQVVSWSARLEYPLSEVPDETQLIYTDTSANSGNWYNVSTGRFQVPDDMLGIYYMSMSVGVPQGGVCATGISSTTGTRRFVGLQFNNNNTDDLEYASRGYMRSFHNTAILQMHADEGSSLLGQPYLTTSWTMFWYGGESNFSVAFSASRNTSYYDFTESIPWEIVRVNDGGPASDGHLNETTGYFTAPLDGFYFFVMSAGSLPENQMQATLNYLPNGQAPYQTVCSLNRTASTSLGMDTTGRSFLLRLSAGDQVSMGNSVGSHLGSSSATLETSFSGFGYALNQTWSAEVVAFCAYMENWSWSGDTSSVIENWTNATVNTAFNGTPFNLSTGIFQAPLEGTYFVSFSIGVQPLSNAIVAMTDNEGYEVARIDRRNKLLNGIDTLSRDVVLDMTSDQNLRLQVGSGFDLLSSDVGKETSFMAIRLREIE